MDRSELQTIVVHVDQLDDGVARRVVHNQRLVFGLRLELLPDGTGGGERVVAVTHRIGHRRFAAREAGDMRGYFVDQLAVVDAPTADPAAAQHQLDVVGFFEIFQEERFDNRALRIVDQHHDMRRLQRRLLPHLYPRRQATLVGALGGADQLLGPVAIIILLKVERDDQPFARRGAPDITLDQHNTGPLLAQHSIRQIFLHPLVDTGDDFFAVGRVEIYLRKNQVQRRGGGPNDPPYFLPVFGLRGVLVAGDDRPRFERYIRPR